MNALPVEKSDLIDEEDLAAASDVEAGIRDFVRNDVAYLRRSVQPPVTSAPETPADASADAAIGSVNNLINRVAGASFSEIEALITELEGLRSLMHDEGRRIQRELTGYAQLGQTAMKSTRMIADNLAQWRRSAPDPRQD